MNNTLWAPLGDALKLIITGSLNQTLTSEQRALFLNVIAKAAKDEAGNNRDLPVLEGVETQKYFSNESKNEFECYWYIPGLVIYLARFFATQSVFNPPISLSYLTSLRNEDGNQCFTSSSKLEQVSWDDAKEGEAQWLLILEKLRLERDISSLEQTQHKNDPLKMQAQLAMRKELAMQLKRVSEKLAARFFLFSPSASKNYRQASDWKPVARDLGLKFHAEYPKLSIKKIAAKVEMGMKEQGIKGRGGKALTAANIERNALQNLIP